MSILKIIFTGFALSMDAATVTVAQTAANPKLDKVKAWAMPVLFSLFQGLMPLIGFYLGEIVSDYIEASGG